MDFVDLVNAGINVAEGISYTGRDDKYLSAVQRFYRSYETNKKNIEDYRQKGDLDNYTILVHSLKSNARTIGADSLSDIAYSLELKGKEQDKAFVDEKTPSLLDEYDRVIGIIKPYGEMEQVKPYDEIDGKEAREIADLLIEALEDYDDEKALALADKLNGYPFRLTQKNRLKEARRYTEDFCYDEASEIIKELLKHIEIE